MLFVFHFTDILENYFSENLTEPAQVLQMIKSYSRTVLEYFKNRHVIGKNMASRNEGILKAMIKIFVWQFLDGKYDTIIV